LIWFGPTLMRSVNSLLYESSTADGYATFFYAQYDPRDRKLAFVNAGHNPPVVLRGLDVLRLEADGPVVALLPCAQYARSSLVLEPGDTLLAYPDGIGECDDHRRRRVGREPHDYRRARM
jgi:sigma-B regulation protein RsbU (phosphoserine phosphatase)